VRTFTGSSTGCSNWTDDGGLCALAPGWSRTATRQAAAAAERIELWTAEYERRVTAAREAAGGRAVDLFKIWRAVPRPSKVMVWSPAYTGVFLDWARRHRLYAAYHLIAFTGLRRGEACGVEWVDVDLKARSLAVRVQRVQIGYDVEEGAPKTEASDAKVALDAGTAAVLKAHRKQQKTD
jgi:integrase